MSFKNVFSQTCNSYIKSVLRYVNFPSNLWSRIKAEQYHKVSINNGFLPNSGVRTPPYKSLRPCCPDKTMHPERAVLKGLAALIVLWLGLEGRNSIMTQTQALTFFRMKSLKLNSLNAAERYRIHLRNWLAVIERANFQITACYAWIERQCTRLLLWNESVGLSSVHNRL